MIWIKCVLAGLASAMIAIVAIVIITSVTVTSMTAGSGGIGFVSVGLFDVVLLPFVLAFALGFWWMHRRQRRRQPLAQAGV